MEQSKNQENNPPEREPGKAGGEFEDSAGRGEIGGIKGPDPARYGDWEKNGRCIDF